MKRTSILALAAVLLLVLQAFPAATQEELPRHKHMLVLGLELDDEGEPVGFRRCVDLAAGRALPLNAHHAHVHTGKAGAALFEKAGHAVVPGAPLTPWNDCAELIAFFFG
jgi:hypothetical protein